MHQHFLSVYMIIINVLLHVHVCIAEVLIFFVSKQSFSSESIQLIIVLYLAD